MERHSPRQYMISSSIRDAIFSHTGGQGAPGTRQQAAAAAPAEKPDLRKYDVLNSPFIELGSPFTAWWELLLLTTSYLLHPTSPASCLQLQL